ncbi:ATP-binding cassette domain-containing protein [Staphylococcus edaphicus]|uniref:ATP-binding cassette domain-containing protein n=1 Tax=Staphylococcus edaphicus TaxID=1955013 RepID=A0ABY4QBL3_9STAP|nr:ATP-binding cassette domain-containing protein [Staphylococcus edaphicus]UQW81831.1 ATP-binding cassette domain-containing protein [Staphylococcus edaphicus]
MLNLIDVSFNYKKASILKHLQLSIQPDEIVGIVGESGSGKTTLAKIMLGILQPTHGHFTTNNERILPIFQHAYDSFNPKFKISKSMSEPIKFQRLFESKELKQRLADLMGDMQLDKKLMNRFPDELSGGQLQRFNTIRTLMMEPDILICDEITASLDVIAEQRMIGILKHYYEATHHGMILISHDLAFLNQIVNRFIVMKDGEIIDDFAVEDLFNERRHEYTKTLLSIY